MNVDEALRQFAQGEEFPREALQWSLDNWDAASPRFISKLRSYAAGASGPDLSPDVLFYIVHLCGEKADARAFTPLCDLIATDETMPDWLGDARLSTLPGILINICDGDVEPLKQAIESEGGDPFARGAALSALAYLVRAKNVLTDDEMREYVLRLGREMRPRQKGFLWSNWAYSIAELGYETLRADVARVFSKGWVDPEDGGLADFYAQLALSRRDADGLAAFHAAEIRPFGSTIEALCEFTNGDAGADDDGVREAIDVEGTTDGEAPYVNPLREVGRNDPCPCGSGKKFKKCCLAASAI